ncbi:eIF2 kinase Gcn2p negative regulator [Apiotrichum porosum]|uniref:eIF2 kinase Gcn2p negative regulator n=1 Tax=Apiotrichum porosum TaxID=105984 RepID=A0A427XCE8_9TREE|nr:eIF2 kinase Gcn2p negative regulator [Apiotrichum porosum]RSH76529.1 eIF2 kinase Gcn2p negative regulator [Apiotrichum porosum]
MDPPRLSADDEGAPTDPEELQEYISLLASDDDRSSIAYELEALESIYPGSIRLRSPGPSRVNSPSVSSPAGSSAGWEDGAEDVPKNAPLLQLLGRYVGAFPIDSGLFGDITRTYITSAGVPFVPGDVCVFDGLVHVQSLVGTWHAARVAEVGAGEAARTGGRSGTGASTPAERDPAPSRAEAAAVEASLARLALERPKPSAKPARPLPKLFTSEPILDRKSAFVGHACKITDEDDVMAVVAHLLEDKRVARAAHPTIWAYRAVREAGGAAGRVVESDYDDDGETQAGSRLKHLLDILELEDVLVVVTRWFGGIHLGPDRFKHINQAARDALELGGLLDEVSGGGGGKKKGRK